MKQQLAWILKTKLKVLAWLLGISLGAIATVAFVGVPWIAAVGVAVAAAAVSISKATHRLSRTTCLDCGTDLANHPIGVHGVVCDVCGAVHQPSPDEANLG